MRKSPKILAKRPSWGRCVEILTHPCPGPYWFSLLYWRVREGLPLWEFPAVESLLRGSGVCASSVPAAWRWGGVGALHSRSPPGLARSPPGPLVGPSWRPGQGRGQSPGLRAQQRLFPFTCPVSLTVLGEGGARCPVPAPDSLSRICFSVPGQDSGKVVIWNMSPVLQEDAEKDERVPKMLCQMDNHLGISGPFAGFACWRSSQGQHVRLWSESSGRAALAPVACCLTRRSWLHTGVSYSAEDPARPQNLLWTVRRYLW